MSYSQFGKSKKYAVLMAQQAAAEAAAKRKADEDAAAKLSVITPDEEMEILQAMMPIQAPQASFIRRNAVPLFVGGGVLTLGLLGMILLIKV